LSLSRTKSAFAAGVAILSALPALSARADDAATREAKSHFDAGVNLLSDPEGARYEEAYAEFKQAFRLSGSATVLGNLGLCAMKLERDGEAIDSYARYLAEVRDIDKQERQQIERDLQTLRVSAVNLDIAVEKGASDKGEVSVVDERLPVRGASFRNVYSVDSSPLHLRVRPGHHVLTVRIGDATTSSWDVDATPGANLSHSFATLAKPTPPAHVVETSRPVAGPVVITSLGAAGLIAGAVLGGLTLGKVGRLEKECTPNGMCNQPGAQAEIDSAHTYVRATDYTLLASGVVAVAGVSWLIWAVVDRRNAPAGHSQGDRARSPNWVGGATFGPHGGFVSLGTAF